MGTQTFKNKLSSAKKLFKKAKKSASEGYDNNVEDGRYKAQLTGAEGPVEAKTSGRLQAVMKYQILDGEFKGETIFSFPNLENEIGLSILIKQIDKLGYEVEDFDDIEGALEAIDKDSPNVKIKVSTKNDFQNISILDVLDGDDVPPEEEEDPEEEPEEDPEEDPEEEPEEEPEEDIELEEGSSVMFMAKGKKLTGKILEVVDAQTVRVEASNGKKYKLNVSKLEVAEPAKKEKKAVKKKIAKKK